MAGAPTFHTSEINLVTGNRYVVVGFEFVLLFISIFSDVSMYKMAPNLTLAAAFVGLDLVHFGIDRCCSVQVPHGLNIHVSVVKNNR